MQLRWAVPNNTLDYWLANFSTKWRHAFFLILWKTNLTACARRLSFAIPISRVNKHTQYIVIILKQQTNIKLITLSLINPFVSAEYVFSITLISNRSSKIRLKKKANGISININKKFLLNMHAICLDSKLKAKMRSSRNQKKCKTLLPGTRDQHSCP